MTTRMTAKQAIEALEAKMDAQTAAISQLADALAGMTAPVASAPAPAPTPTVETAPEAKPSFTVRPKHLARMQVAWKKLAVKRDATVYGYAYRKADGSVGLWGCSAEELPDRKAKDNYLGLVEVVEAS